MLQGNGRAAGQSGGPSATEKATGAKRAQLTCLRWAEPWRSQTTAWPSSVDREGHPRDWGSFSLGLPGPPPPLAAQTAFGALWQLEGEGFQHIHQPEQAWRLLSQTQHPCPNPLHKPSHDAHMTPRHAMGIALHVCASSVSSTRKHDEVLAQAVGHQDLGSNGDSPFIIDTTVGK